VLDTVADLLRAGIAPADLIVIDNSEDEALVAALRTRLPTAVRVLEVANAGYGPALNVGLDALATNVSRHPFVLTVTHEVRLRASALRALVTALESEPRAAAAGPTLVTPGNDEYWSLGGGLSRWLNVPVHVTDDHAADAKHQSSVSRDWLDGACILYRSAVVDRLRFRDEFFLYFEEVDLHIRMRRLGWRVLWVPAARASQSTKGTPPFLLARNLHRFQGLHGNRAQRLATTPTVIVRKAVRHGLRGGPDGEIAALVRGWIAARRGSGGI
jgi:GT2 family glycosyltransferase